MNCNRSFLSSRNGWPNGVVGEARARASAPNTNNGDLSDKKSALFYSPAVHSVVGVRAAGLCALAITNNIFCDAVSNVMNCNRSFLSSRNGWPNAVVGEARAKASAPNTNNGDLSDKKSALFYSPAVHSVVGVRAECLCGLAITNNSISDAIPNVMNCNR